MKTRVFLAKLFAFWASTAILIKVIVILTRGLK